MYEDAVKINAPNSLIFELLKLGKKSIELFLRPFFFEKQMRQGGFLFSFSKKQMQEHFFFQTRNNIFLSCALTVISSDFIQVRP